MKNYMVLFQGNYADEFDLSGFAIMSEAAIEQLKQDAAEHFEKYDYYNEYFGSNQCLTWESAHQLLSDFVFIEINEDDIGTLRRLFNDQLRFPGYFPKLEYLNSDD